MKTLDRVEIERLVGVLEAEAYGLALELERDRERAASALLKAFAGKAPDFPRQPEDRLKKRIMGALRKTLSDPDGWSVPLDGTAAVPVPARLHTDLVDIVEEHQQDEPLGARKRLLAAIGGALLVGVLAGFLFVRWSALQAAQPSVKESNPVASATEIPVQGNLWVRFGISPSSKPSITLDPMDGTLDPADWDGRTVLVTYRGLHLARSYTMTVTADYKSKYGDVGHFVRQLRFTTEGYPVIIKLEPDDGATGAFRYGQLQITFNHRPPVEPAVTVDPAGTAFTSGQWNSATWEVNYSALAPSTTYQVTVVVDYQERKANIRQHWSFTTEGGAPPPGLPVIWYSISAPDYQARTPQRLVALDWRGGAVGIGYQVGVVRQTWDGALLGAQDGSFYDVNSSPVRSTTLYNGSLADDSRTICDLEGAGMGGDGSYSLSLGTIGGAPRQVARLRPLSSGYLAIPACSMRQNRAVVIESSGGMAPGVVTMRLIALSSGQVLYQHTYTGVLPSNLVVSRDCRFVAEQMEPVDAQGQPLAWSTVIRRSSDGVIVARLPNQRVVAFSWDDTRVVTAPLWGAAANELQLMNWQTGQVLWHKSLPQDVSNKELVYAVAQPDGPDVAIAFSSQPLPNGGVDQLWLVGKDGAASQVLNGIFYSPIFNSF